MHGRQVYAGRENHTSFKPARQGVPFLPQERDLMMDTESLPNPSKDLPRIRFGVSVLVFHHPDCTYLGCGRFY